MYNMPTECYSSKSLLMDDTIAFVRTIGIFSIIYLLLLFPAVYVYNITCLFCNIHIYTHTYVCLFTLVRTQHWFKLFELIDTNITQQLWVVDFPIEDMRRLRPLSRDGELTADA